jgi:ATP-dependent Lon protease
MNLPETTREVVVPKNPLEMIIGQNEAVEIAKVVAKQRRNLLLVGPPGTGKSMIAQSIACLLKPPTQRISILHNPDNPERPILEVSEKQTNKVDIDKKKGKLLYASEVPMHVAEKLGYKCKSCGNISRFSVQICPTCGSSKYKKNSSPFDDLVVDFPGEFGKEKVETKKYKHGKEEIIVYERADDAKIRCYAQSSSKFKEIERSKFRKVIVPLKRNTFIQATGASETELVGDVKHDPYGGHPEVGIQPYLRVVPGAIHEAHEGVLFIDELANLGYLQRYLLTAMQEKKFPITGRNASSTGAAVKVEDVPCNFIFVGSLNINDITSLLPPLRSRIIGNGYEVLLNTHMEDNDANRVKLLQFIAQEIIKDGKIPHANAEALDALINEAKKRAKLIDNVNGLTLRLRDLSGIIKLAGDLAHLEESEFIELKHVQLALKRGKTVEEQVSERYGSWWRAGMSDYAGKRKKVDEREIA